MEPTQTFVEPDFLPPLTRVTAVVIPTPEAVAVLAIMSFDLSVMAVRVNVKATNLDSHPANQ